MFSIYSLLNLILVAAILFHIRHQANRIGENWAHLILPTFFFWWLVYPLWLFLWPGMWRPSRIGKDPAEYLALTWARRRLANRKSEEKSSS